MASPPAGRLGRSVAIALILVSVALGGLVAAPHVAAGGTDYVAGNVCALGLNTWGSGSTIIMYRNVTVPAGCVLTIEPGVFVKANPGVHLYVDGQLLANGTAASVSTFDTNGTAVAWTWGGIQFNRSASPSYLQYASLHQVDRAIKAVRSSPTLMHDAINRAVVGLTLEDSSASFGWSTINYTNLGIRINGSASSPSISTDTIQVVFGNPALGIYVEGANTPFVLFNTIRWVNGTAGLNGVSAGAAGQAGAAAVGILVNGTSFPIVNVNTVDQVNGGTGGNGQGNVAGNGGAGGVGGAAVGIALGNAAKVKVQSDAVTNLKGGRGGNGGSAGVGFTAGAGGAGGYAAGLEALDISTSTLALSNTVRGVTGGSAGDSGAVASGAFTGFGGTGGDAYGFYLSKAMAANATLNVIQTLLGGYGGNGTGGGRGGPGGQAAGIWDYGVDGANVLANNSVSTLTGGTASNFAAAGGNATGILVLGDGAPFNLTAIQNNKVATLLGGTASLGGNPGATGGAATALGAIHVQLQSSNNLLQSVQGGTGGGNAGSNPNGAGGTAVGLLTLVLSGVSSRDRIQSVTGGAPGTGGAGAPARIGIGFYTLGNTTIRATTLLVNDSFSSTGTDDLYLNNYTATTALNTTFASSKITVEAAANLTVQNYLAVQVYWPDNTTLVAGATVTVTDNAATVYSQAAPTGSAAWIVVTNRVYIDSTVATWNVTDVSVTDPGHTFYNSPRNVNMTSGQSLRFFMLDTTAPTSSASPLPTWESSRTFTIHFSYSDGTGVGVASVTVWVSAAGAPWSQAAVVAVSGSGSGQVSYTAPADGIYAFATTAVDNAGNQQTPDPPVSNNTWTDVDTTAPMSAVTTLPRWETSLSFTVSWGPDPGVTDIAFYQVQYDHGAGWVTWLGDTTATSAVFDISTLGLANTQGVFQFRTLAHDFAGNVESKSVNDTWTTVDTVPPSSLVAPLPSYETSVSFAVAWGPAAGTTDIANYTLQVSADRGAWQVWFAGATNLSATFHGVDGHAYAFRSLATDRAGNVESKTGNDTWTIVDATPPTSAVTALPRYETVVAFTITWGPTGSTTDIATYSVQISTDGGAWQPWLVGVANRSATMAGANGHTYAFRSLATDRAGNVESKTGNDTWTTIDTLHPSIIQDAPEGSGVNLTPAVVVTFSEPMDPTTTRQAFSITPAINGAFTWSGNGTVLTFVPSRPLLAGTAYAVTIDTTATDLAGNALTASKTFQFTTVASGAPSGGLDLGGSLLPLLVLVLAAVGAALFLVYRRRTAQAAAEEAPPKAAAPAKEPSAIDDVFLLYGRDGVLIKHETRRLRPDIDTDILSGMLTAVQQFVKDSFRGEEGEELNEMTVGQMHILIGRGKWLILAAMITGGDVDAMTEQMKRAIADMEDHHWDQLEDWDGDMELAKTLSPYLRKLIRGDYAPGAEPPRKKA